MCRALRVLCAAADPDRLGELKRASVGVHWELVGGATSVEELRTQLDEHDPDVVVAEASLGPEALHTVRESRPSLRLVALGSLAGADAEVGGLGDIRTAILGLPRPGGPVRA